MKPRTTAELVALMLTSMHARPCLRKQLLIDLGLPPSRTELIKPHMRALIDSGLVRIAAWQDQNPLFRAQSAPFALPDEPKPIRPEVARREPRWHMTPERVPKAAAAPLRPASVFNLGAL